MADLRTDEMRERYQKHLELHSSDGVCALCTKEPLNVFIHWKILDNEFPYDFIAKEHHMLLPKRHVKEDGLNTEELQEFIAIKKDYINNRYEYMLEAMVIKKSIPDHYHIHLIVIK